MKIIIFCETHLKVFYHGSSYGGFSLFMVPLSPEKERRRDWNYKPYCKFWWGLAGGKRVGGESRLILIPYVQNDP